MDSAPGMGQTWTYGQTGEGDAGKQCHAKGPEGTG